MENQQEILDPFYLDKLVKWEKLTDEVLLLDVEVQKLRIQKKENKEMFELYRNPTKIKEKHQFFALGKHFVKMSTKEAYKELETHQGQVQKILLEKEKALNKKIDEFIASKPSQDIIHFRVEELINQRMEELEDERD